VLGALDPGFLAHFAQGQEPACGKPPLALGVADGMLGDFKARGDGLTAQGIHDVLHSLLVHGGIDDK